MAEHKKTYSGVKITQNPGGNSNFSLGWGHKEEPAQKPGKNIEYQPPHFEVNTSIKSNNTEPMDTSNSQQNSSGKKSNVKISNPPGGKSSFTFG